MNSQSQDFFNNYNFIDIFLKHKSRILIITGIGITIGLIYTSLIDYKYKSVAIIYSTSGKPISNILLESAIQKENDIMQFGDQSESEKLLQILISNNIRENIIKKFELMAHYEIDTNSTRKLTNLFKLYESNIKFRLTRYSAIEITVYDKDAQKAADIANGIITILDSTCNKIKKDRAFNALQIIENQYFELKNEIERDIDSLNKFEINNSIYNNLYQKNNSKQEENTIIKHPKLNLKKTTTQLTEVTSKYYYIRKSLECKIEQLGFMRTKYDAVKTDLTVNLPQLFVIDYAIKPEKPDYSIRWIILIVITFTSLMVAFIMSNVIELNTNHIKKNTDLKN